jgi:hypothetical protein
VLYNLGVLLALDGRFVEAEPVWRALLARAPQDDAARVALGLSLLALGRGGEGLDALEPTRSWPRERCGETLTRLAELAARAPALQARAGALQARLRSDACRP